MKKSILVLCISILFTACSGKTGGNFNSVSSNSVTNTNTNSASKIAPSESDKPAINKDAFGFYMEIKESPDPKAFIGRSVTVTELDLKEVESSTLHLGYSWYFFVDCEGSFSHYLSVKDVVAKRAKDKPVQATIKGVIKEASIETVKIEPCVLIDVKK